MQKIPQIWRRTLIAVATNVASSSTLVVPVGRDRVMS